MVPGGAAHRSFAAFVARTFDVGDGPAGGNDHEQQRGHAGIGAADGRSEDE
ncbi:MAG: hypothetical protein ACK4MF_07335 [Hyphomicrobiaceae bacterium]